MPDSAFRCPHTGMNVQRPFAPDPAVDPSIYEYVSCLACGQQHLMNKSTGELIGERERTAAFKTPPSEKTSKIAEPTSLVRTGIS
jgi:hypothetical protein